MATIKAFIRTSTKEKSFVNVRFRLTDGRSIQLFHKSDIKVSPADFDAKGEKIKAKIIFNDKQRKDFDKSITDRKDLISDLYINAPDKSTLTSEWLEDAIDRKLNPDKYISEQPAPTTLLAHIADFIEKAPTRKKKKSNTLISPNTIKSYVSNQNRLIEFAKHKGKKDFDFSEINQQFYNDYVDFLTNKKRVIKSVGGVEVNEVRQYTKNTIGDAIKALKNMISDVKGLDIEMKDLYVFVEDVDNIYLTEKELQQLKDLDLSEKPHLDRVRDNFLCLAWTCSRISDLEKIANTKNGYIEYRQQKTSNKVVIPLHPVVKDILEKYNGQLPKMSDKNLNDYIKDCCELAGIDQLETINRTIGGTLTQKTMPKYKLVGSHTGRRSFCTNMYLRGLDTLMIMSISGHKTEASFLKYIKVSQQQHAEMMAKKWSEIYK
jgi:integrase